VRFQPYPNYKSSGIDWLGDVPETWDVKRSRFVSLINVPAPLLRRLNDNDEVSFVPMDAVGEWGGLRLDETKPICEIGAGYTEFQDGDVIIAKITPCFENGKGAIALGLVNGVAFGTTELHVVRAGKHINNIFLFYVTISHAYRKLGEAEMYGAGGQKRVPPAYARNFRMPIPPLSEQQAIADFLDAETAKLDGLVEKKRTLIERLKEKRSALISRTVTRGLPADAAAEYGLDPSPPLKASGIDWLGDIPAHWDVKRSRFVSLINVPAPLLRRLSDDDEVSFVPMDAVGEWGGLRLEETKPICNIGAGYTEFQDGDVIIAKITPCFENGKGAIALGLVNGVAFGTTELHVVRAGKHINNIFLFYVTISHAYRKLGEAEMYGAGGQKRVPPAYARNFRMPIPPFSEQQAIANFLDRETAKIDQLVAKVEDAIARLQEYRSALITAAVTGKIDVRGVAA
jgi:type I restriction enzyme S subunit